MKTNKKDDSLNIFLARTLIEKHGINSKLFKKIQYHQNNLQILSKDFNIEKDYIKKTVQLRSFRNKLTSITTEDTVNSIDQRTQKTKVYKLKQLEPSLLHRIVNKKTRKDSSIFTNNALNHINVKNINHEEALTTTYRDNMITYQYPYKYSEISEMNNLKSRSRLSTVIIDENNNSDLSNSIRLSSKLKIHDSNSYFVEKLPEIFDRSASNNNDIHAIKSNPKHIIHTSMTKDMTLIRDMTLTADEKAQNSLLGEPKNFNMTFRSKNHLQSHEFRDNPDLKKETHKAYRTMQRVGNISLSPHHIMNHKLAQKILMIQNKNIIKDRQFKGYNIKRLLSESTSPRFNQILTV